MFQLILLHLLTGVIPISAQIYMGFPFNEQLPNVGRVDQNYTFTIAETTYKSDNNARITYEVQGLPNWLHFDSVSRTFSGKPAQENVGNFEITLIGTDTSDSTRLSNKYQMMVSQDPGLKLASPEYLTKDISRFGETNGDKGLVVKEGQNINLQLDRNIFVSQENSGNPIIAYYGRSADRSPLPNWLQFNSGDTSFSGTVPNVTSQNAPSFDYGFSFIATDYDNFAGAEVIFKLVVGGHPLSATVNEPIPITGDINSDINVDVQQYISDKVKLDGNPIANDQIYRVSTKNLPGFIQFDDNAKKLTGKFPNTETSHNVIIKINDIYQSNVELTFLFETNKAAIFKVPDIPSVNATMGDFFELSLGKYVSDSVELQVNFDGGWLNYNDQNKILTGVAPEDLSSLKVSLVGALNENSETKEFSINGVKKEVTSSTSSSSTSSTSSTKTSSSTTSSSTSATTNEPSETSTTAAPSTHNKQALAIGLGAGLGGLALLLAALLLFCCIKKRNNDKDDEKDLEGVKRTISPPQDVKSTLNLTKSDQVKQESELKSMSSSMTHVADEQEYSKFARQPHPGTVVEVGEDAGGAIKSWRANSDSDLKRVSEASMSTVNTEQLFSVRLVEDQSNDNSVTSSRYMSTSPTAGNLVRDESGNIQRLDSDGNIVETLYNQQPNSRPASSLYNVTEENTYEISQSRRYEDSVDLSDSNSDYSSHEGQENVQYRPWGFEPGLNTGAKLVDFTRRGSLKDSSRDPSGKYFQPETAQIHENDSE